MTFCNPVPNPLLFLLNLFDFITLILYLMEAFLPQTLIREQFSGSLYEQIMKRCNVMNIHPI